MNGIELMALVIVGLLCVYLGAALLKPEWFG